MCTERAYHCLCELMLDPRRNGAVDVDFVHEFIKSGGPDYTVILMKYYMECKVYNIVACVFLLVLPLCKGSWGLDWLRVNYYKIIECYQCFEIRRDILDYADGMAEKVTAIWQIFKARFNAIHARESKIHEAELLADEEREKKKKEEKSSKRKKKQKQRKLQTEKDKECDAQKISMASDDDEVDRDQETIDTKDGKQKKYTILPMRIPSKERLKENDWRSLGEKKLEFERVLSKKEQRAIKKKASHGKPVNVVVQEVGPAEIVETNKSKETEDSEDLLNFRPNMGKEPPGKEKCKLVEQRAKELPWRSLKKAPDIDSPGKDFPILTKGQKQSGVAKLNQEKFQDVGPTINHASYGLFVKERNLKNAAQSLEFSQRMSALTPLAPSLEIQKAPSPIGDEKKRKSLFSPTKDLTWNDPSFMMEGSLPKHEINDYCMFNDFTTETLGKNENIAIEQNAMCMTPPKLKSNPTPKCDVYNLAKRAKIFFPIREKIEATITVDEVITHICVKGTNHDNKVIPVMDVPKEGSPFSDFPKNVYFSMVPQPLDGREKTSRSASPFAPASSALTPAVVYYPVQVIIETRAGQDEISHVYLDDNKGKRQMLSVIELARQTMERQFIVTLDHNQEVQNISYAKVCPDSPSKMAWTMPENKADERDLNNNGLLHESVATLDAGLTSFSDFIDDSKPFCLGADNISPRKCLNGIPDAVIVSPNSPDWPPLDNAENTKANKKRSRATSFVKEVADSLLAAEKMPEAAIKNGRKTENVKQLQEKAIEGLEEMINICSDLENILNIKEQEMEEADDSLNESKDDVFPVFNESPPHVAECVPKSTGSHSYQKATNTPRRSLNNEFVDDGHKLMKAIYVPPLALPEDISDDTDARSGFQFLSTPKLNSLGSVESQKQESVEVSSTLLDGVTDIRDIEFGYFSSHGNTSGSDNSQKSCVGDTSVLCELIESPVLREERSQLNENLPVNTLIASSTSENQNFEDPSIVQGFLANRSYGDLIASNVTSNSTDGNYMPFPSHNTKFNDSQHDLLNQIAFSMSPIQSYSTPVQHAYETLLDYSPPKEDRDKPNRCLTESGDWFHEPRATLIDYDNIYIPPTHDAEFSRLSPDKHSPGYKETSPDKLFGSRLYWNEPSFFGYGKTDGISQLVNAQVEYLHHNDLEAVYKKYPVFGRGAKFEDFKRNQNEALLNRITKWRYRYDAGDARGPKADVGIDPRIASTFIPSHLLDSSLESDPGSAELKGPSPNKLEPPQMSAYSQRWYGQSFEDYAAPMDRINNYNSVSGDMYPGHMVGYQPGAPVIGKTQPSHVNSYTSQQPPKTMPGFHTGGVPMSAAYNPVSRLFSTASSPMRASTVQPQMSQYPAPVYKTPPPQPQMPQYPMAATSQSSHHSLQYGKVFNNPPVSYPMNVKQEYPVDHDNFFNLNQGTNKVLAVPLEVRASQRAQAGQGDSHQDMYLNAAKQLVEQQQAQQHSQVYIEFCF